MASNPSSTPTSPNPAMTSQASSPKPPGAAMASAPSPPASPADEEPESETPDIPLTMTASTLLMALPRDATAALAAVPGFPKEKIVVRFKPVGSAPAFEGRDVVQVRSVQKFDFIVSWLRKKLRVRPSDSVFLYVNSTFAPSLDEVVGNLWMVSLLGSDMRKGGLRMLNRFVLQCFKDSNNQLNVSYSMTPAFG